MQANARLQLSALQQPSPPRRVCGHCPNSGLGTPESFLCKISRPQCACLFLGSCLGPGPRQHRPPGRYRSPFPPRLPQASQPLAGVGFRFYPVFPDSAFVAASFSPRQDTLVARPPTVLRAGDCWCAKGAEPGSDGARARAGSGREGREATGSSRGTSGRRMGRSWGAGRRGRRGLKGQRAQVGFPLRLVIVRVPTFP